MIKDAIRSPYGRLVMAAVLGFGLSTLFRKSCTDKSCLNFESPQFDQIESKKFKFDDKCYSFTSSPAKCSSQRKTVNIKSWLFA